MTRYEWDAGLEDFSDTATVGDGDAIQAQFHFTPGHWRCAETGDLQRMVLWMVEKEIHLFRADGLADQLRRGVERLGEVGGVQLQQAFKCPQQARLSGLGHVLGRRRRGMVAYMRRVRHHQVISRRRPYVARCIVATVHIFTRAPCPHGADCLWRAASPPGVSWRDSSACVARTLCWVFR